MRATVGPSHEVAAAALWTECGRPEVWNHVHSLTITRMTPLTLSFVSRDDVTTLLN